MNSYIWGTPASKILAAAKKSLLNCLEDSRELSLPNTTLHKVISLLEGVINPRPNFWTLTVDGVLWIEQLDSMRKILQDEDDGMNSQSTKDFLDNFQQFEHFFNVVQKHRWN